MEKFKNDRFISCLVSLGLRNPSGFMATAPHRKSSEKSQDTFKPLKVLKFKTVTLPAPQVIRFIYEVTCFLQEAFASILSWSFTPPITTNPPQNNMSSWICCSKTCLKCDSEQGLHAGRHCGFWDAKIDSILAWCFIWRLFLCKRVWNRACSIYVMMKQR